MTFNEWVTGIREQVEQDIPMVPISQDQMQVWVDKCNAEAARRIAEGVREACAKVCETGVGFDGDHPHDAFAAAIRAVGLNELITESEGPQAEAKSGHVTVSLANPSDLPNEYPPVPKQLLWMFDGIDRKEAIRMMHDYATSAITFKPSKALLRAWEDVQQSGDRALRLEDENRQLKIALKIKTEEHDCCAEDLMAITAGTNALLHQIDIGDFIDSNGHSAKMLKATHDLMRLSVP